MQVTVLGAGSWGTALTVLLARQGHEVQLLGRDPEAVSQLCAIRENLHYLPGHVLSASVSFGLAGEVAPVGQLRVLAVPSHSVDECFDWLQDAENICIAAKGLGDDGHLLSRMVEEACPNSHVSVLSGPNLAKEVARGVPTAAVAASREESAALMVRGAFMAPSFRVYVTDDVTGVEVAGALKNVMAIAAGMSDGLGYGDNTKATLVARGLSEMAKVGMAMGARLETFMGVAGVGDLFATAASGLSRNYRVGKALAEGQKLEQILADLGQVAEGVPTCESAVALTQRLGVDAPIMTHVLEVIRGRCSAKEVVGRLMERTTLHEGLGEIFGSRG